MKKFLLLILSVLFFFTACNKKTTEIINNSDIIEEQAPTTVLVGNIPCNFPLSTSNAKLNILLCRYGDIDPSTVYVWEKYHEMTGIDINWTPITKPERNESVSTILSLRQNYDLFMRCLVTAEKLTKYGERNLIYDLAKDDLLKNNAPNCWAYLQSHPDTLASIMNPDGSIYSLPQVNSGAELRVALKIYVNKQWLNQVGMQLPKTTEEFYNLLLAFKTQDANGNGDVNDEIPMSCADWGSVQNSLSGAFGLANRGYHNLIVDCDESTGKVRLIAANEDYKKYLQYLNRLYSEQLLDNYIFTITTNQWTNNISNNRVGVFASTNLASIPADQTDNWVAIEEALQGPDGYKLWSPVRANFHSVGAAVIPTTCKNPELVLRWLDYFWTDEGTLFYHLGKEGDTFVALPDGTYDYTQAIYDRMTNENKTFDDIIAQYSPYPGGSNPTVEIAPYFKGGEMAPIPSAAARSLFKYAPKEFWPCFTFTADENDRLSSLQTDIKKYYNAMLIEFISGSRPFDYWEEYIDQLEKLGQAELLEIYQAALDRYNTYQNDHQ